MMRALLLLLALMACVFAAATGVQPDRKIAPGDRIKMTCVEEPSLNKEYTVTADGLMLIDFLGAVQVANLTMSEAAQRISTKLVNDRILRKATLSMVFVNLPAPPDQKVKVVGAVKKKDAVAWVTGMRVADVIRIAIAENNADLTKLVVARADGTTVLVDFSRFSPSNNANNPELRPGDEVRVPVKAGGVNGGGGQTGGGQTGGSQTGGSQTGGSQTGGSQTGGAPTGGFVIILGGVAKPGTYAMRSGLTLEGAIELAGGYGLRGDRSKVRLERKSAVPQLFNLSVDKGDYPLLAGDQITIEVTSQRQFVQVGGGVKTPGLVAWTEGLTLSQAVAASGGILPTARGNDVVVRGATDTKGRKVNYDDIIRGYRGDVLLKAGDIIQVGGGSIAAPNPAPAPKGGGSTTGKSSRKSSDTAIVVVAAGLLIWLIGR